MSSSSLGSSEIATSQYSQKLSDRLRSTLRNSSGTLKLEKLIPKMPYPIRDCGKRCFEPGMCVIIARHDLPGSAVLHEPRGLKSNGQLTRIHSQYLPNPSMQVPFVRQSSIIKWLGREILVPWHDIDVVKTLQRHAFLKAEN
ncbi:hypothetical protein ETB97_004643 [Aspergillus alliaceus]|uniref:Uncharacterized protein n=1 Tax=Petromyces alliaceus TaxID=209559 RepID=A0A8H5ZZR4_PETAA|nr:hypothetical protein ETB97_004643 [Aspergillus burnettii]